MSAARTWLGRGCAAGTLAARVALRLDTDWFKTFAPAFFEAGPETRTILLDLIPDDFAWEGKRVMDFGCGAGRTLVNFRDEAEVAEIWGVDVYEGALKHVQAELCPPMKAHLCEENPPLPVEDACFDLIWAISVWTHLTDNSLPWLAEMHRILKPGGLFIPTYMGESHSEPLAGEEWDENRIGMNVLRHYQGWDRGGPMVLISDWWMREHWGRAFEVLEVRHNVQKLNWPLLRKRNVRVTVEELARLSDDPREIVALRHNLRQVQREVEMAVREGEEHVAVERARYERMRAEFENSLSWRLTRPLRAARRLGRRRAAD
jgi:SAM-dependent methyltransferase